MMGAFERREAEKRDAERAKNYLEAYIISTGSVLEDGAFDEVSPALPALQRPPHQPPVELILSSQWPEKPPALSYSHRPAAASSLCKGLQSTP